jgi:UDP-N-acetylmuramoyl-L-alanyl-D-glutamate--2,6-diaminopimelate ligase
MPESAPDAHHAPDPEITGLTADSRAVEPGFLFAALPGSNADGRSFIPDAVGRGAAAVLAPPGTELPPDDGQPTVRLITEENPRRRFALLAARFFGAQPRVICAVTGTNGKTSVAWFTQQIWAAIGHSCATMGTLGLHGTNGAVGRIGDSGPALTTADPVTLHRELAALAAREVDYLVLEASSHGLEQARLDGITFRAGAFTNISRDHLDYHGTMEAYRAAKLRLFTALLPPAAHAVLNADSDDFDAFREAAEGAGQKIITFGRQATDIRLVNAMPGDAGQRLEIEVFGARHQVDFPLPAMFQAINALCALGLVIACGDAGDAALEALTTLDGVPGRLQLVARRDNGAPVYVDYAHTPDALAHVLAALRPHTVAKLVVVFGCGGDRDSGKRAEMGTVARRLADVVMVTDDNPRTEDAAAIRSAILAACRHATEFDDRAAAIHAAAAGLGPGDVLVICGKGHETGQIVGDTVYPFVDADVARAAVAAIEGRGA